MNDKAQGALEALAWVENLLEATDERRVKAEIKGAIQDLLTGVSVDFRGRIKRMI